MAHFQQTVYSTHPFITLRALFLNAMQIHFVPKLAAGCYHGKDNSTMLCQARPERLNTSFYSSRAPRPPEGCRLPRRLPDNSQKACSPTQSPDYTEDRSGRPFRLPNSERGPFFLCLGDGHLHDLRNGHWKMGLRVQGPIAVVLDRYMQHIAAGSSVPLHVCRCHRGIEISKGKPSRDHTLHARGDTRDTFSQRNRTACTGILHLERSSGGLMPTSFTHKSLSPSATPAAQLHNSLHTGLDILQIRLLIHGPAYVAKGLCKQLPVGHVWSDPKGRHASRDNSDSSAKFPLSLGHRSSSIQAIRVYEISWLILT